MSDRGSVKSIPLTFGTATTTGSTNTAVPNTVGTATSNPVLGPRDDYSMQVSVSVMTTQTGTATLAIGGTVVLQTSNDGANWLNQASATALATATVGSTATVVTTGSAAAAAAVTMTAKYAYVRAVVTATGSGTASPRMAF